MTYRVAPPRQASLLRLSTPRITQFGTSSLLFEAPGALSLNVQQRIWAMQTEMTSHPSVTATHPGMNSLMVRYDALRTDPDTVTGHLHRCWDTLEPQPLTDRIIEITVDYGGPDAPDFAVLCRRTRLTPTSAADAHAAQDYVVFVPGNKGGFGYLFGLPEALFMPRKPQPASVRGGGQIMIGGLQCNLVAGSGPERARLTGWNVIGRACEVPRAFDLTRHPPTLTRPGDRIRFRVGEVRP